MSAGATGLVGLSTHSSSVVPSPGEAVSSRVAAWSRSATTASPAIDGKPLHDADDAPADRLALHEQRHDAVRAGGRGDRGGREHRQRHAVGRLPGTEDADAVRCQQVAERRPVAAHAPRSDEARERRANRLPVDRGAAEVEHAPGARLDAGARVRGDPAVVQDVELEPVEGGVPERDAAVQEDAPRAVRAPEVDRRDVAERRAEERADSDVVAARRDGQREATARGQRLRAERHAPRREPPGERLA